MWLTATAFVSALQCIVYEYGVAQQMSMSSNAVLCVHPWAIQPQPNLFKCWRGLVCNVTCLWCDHK